MANYEILNCSVTRGANFRLVDLLLESSQNGRNQLLRSRAYQWRDGRSELCFQEFHSLHHLFVIAVHAHKHGNLNIVRDAKDSSVQIEDIQNVTPRVGCTGVY